jgi:NADH-quinone oxidoreductase subunit L
MVLAPALAAVVGLLIGGLSRAAAAVAAVAGPGAALVLALVLVADRPWTEPVTDNGFVSTVHPFAAATTVDGMAITVALMVCLVATLVQIYSIGYMRGEPRYGSYSAFISLFTAAMLAVVVSGDLLILLVGWEVMGLCSYLLIGQQWEQENARRAAVKAFMVTKVGDIGFILGIVVLIGATGTASLTDAVRAAAEDPTVAVVASSLLLLGVLGKSAQFPLHAWLPDAMAGPSPVSALIHAATMVAAGIYVVARFYPMFLAAPAVLTVMAAIACVTMFGAAVIALAQSDLKRVLAWSTVSQLAYMLAALAVGSREAAIFHLLSHAFFKALLFLAAGVVIHQVGTSSLAQLGGLRRVMPVTFATMTVGLLALVGVFPLAGFFSKESILVAAERAGHGEAPVNAAVGWLVLAAALLTVVVTAAYATRLWVLVWLDEGRGPQPARDGLAVMTIPLVVLSVPTIFFGWLAWDDRWLPTWVTASATEPGVSTTEFTVVVGTAAATVVAVVLGIGLWLLMRRRFERWFPADGLVASGFGVDRWYEVLVVRPWGSVVDLVMTVDSAVIGRVVSGVGEGAQSAGSGIQGGHRGDVQRYVTVTYTSVVVVLVVLLVAVAT